MTLLGPIPLHNQAVPEGQCCTSICSTVEKISNQHSFPSYVGSSTHSASQLNIERANVVSMCLTTSFSKSSLLLNSATLYSQDQSAIVVIRFVDVHSALAPTNFFHLSSGTNGVSTLSLPGRLITVGHLRRSLSLWDARFHTLDLVLAKPRHGPFVLGATHARWAHGILKVRNGRRCARLPLARRCHDGELVKGGGEDMERVEGQSWGGNSRIARSALNGDL